MFEKLRTPTAATTSSQSGADPAGVEMLRRGEIADALNWGREQTRTNPEDAIGWAVVGAAYVEWEDAEPAVEALRKATSLAPEVGALHYELARAHLQAGQTEEAERSIKRAIQVEPEDPDHTELLARMKLDEGQVDDALELLETCAEQASASESVQQALAVAYLRSAYASWTEIDDQGYATSKRDVDQARVALEKARVLEVRDETVRAAIEELTADVAQQSKYRFDGSVWRTAVFVLIAVVIGGMGSAIWGLVWTWVTPALLIWGKRVPQYVINRRALGSPRLLERMLGLGSNKLNESQSSSPLALVLAVVMIAAMPLMALLAAVRKWQDMSAAGANPMPFVD